MSTLEMPGTVTRSLELTTLTSPGRLLRRARLYATVVHDRGAPGRRHFVAELPEGAAVFALAVPVRTLMQQRSDLGRLQREEKLLAQQNTALKDQIARLHDPAYLERIARECLGMTKPGEI